MTGREQYKRTFNAVVSSGMKPMEANELMNQTQNITPIRHHIPRQAIAAVAAIILAVSCTGAAYAVNVGGIQRTVQLWLHGDQTSATLTIEDDGSYNVTYELPDGTTQAQGGGGIAIEWDGSERPLTEEEILEVLASPSPEVEYQDDGTVLVYYYDQTLDITDSFTDGICYVKLEHDGKTGYLTIKYDNGYAYSEVKFVSADTFNN